MPCICKQKVERNQAKIKCLSCNEYYHCSCVNMLPADIDYLHKSGKKFKCKKCSAARRDSLRSPVLNAGQPQKLQQLEVDKGLSLAAADPTKIIVSTHHKESPVLAENIKSSHNQQNEQRNNLQLLNKSSQNLESPLLYQHNEQRTHLHLHQQQQQNLGLSMPQLQQQQQCGNNQVITLEKVFNEIVALRSENAAALSLINSLQEDKNFLLQQVSELQNEVNFLQQERREKYVEIVGVPDVNNANALDCALQVFSKGTCTDISEAHIDDCFVKKVKTGNLLSNILVVKFLSVLKKKEIMKKKGSMKNNLTSKIFNSEKESKIYINESLNSKTRHLLKAARIVQKERFFKYVWVRNGRVLMRKSDNDNYIIINSVKDLETINK